MKTSALLGVAAVLLSAVACSGEEKSAICTVNVAVAEQDSETMIELARRFSVAEGGRFSLVRHPGLVSFGYQAQRSEMIGSNPFEPGEFMVHFYARRPGDVAEASEACDRFLGIVLGADLAASKR